MRPSKRLLIAAVFTVSFLTFANTLYNGFVYDDIFIIVNNAWIRDIRNIPAIFTSTLWGFKAGSDSNYYRPLVHVVLMAEHYAFGLKAWGYHLVNAVVYSLNAVIVFLICSALFRQHLMDKGCAAVSGCPGKDPESGAPDFTVAVFGAVLIFAVHPVHSEAVGLASIVAELSLSLLYFLSFYLYIRHTESPAGLKGPAMYAASIALFTADLFLKETALTLIAVIFSYDFFFRGALRRGRASRSVLKLAPYAAAVALYLALRGALMGSIVPVKQHAYMNAFQYVLNVFPLLKDYMRLLVWPSGLNAFHSFHPVLSLSDRGAALSVAAVAVAAAFFLYMRSRRLVFFSALWFMLSLAPVLYIPGVGGRGVAFAERYLYIPSAGFALLLSALFYEMLKRLKKGPYARHANALLFVILSVPFAAFAALTIGRNAVWHDSYSLWKDTSVKTTDSYVVYNNLGSSADELGLRDEAEAAYVNAIRIEPYMAEAHNNLGLVYFEKGEYDRALESYKKALLLTANYGYLASIRENIGNAYMRKGLMDAALAEYSEAVDLGMESERLYANIGSIYLEKGMLKDARENFSRALALNPASAPARAGLAAAGGM